MEVKLLQPWTHLEELSGPIRTLHFLRLTCKVDLLCLCYDGLEEDHTVEQLCEDVRPVSLHSYCILARALPSVTSASNGCTDALRAFCLETVLDIQIGKKNSPREDWEDRRANFVRTLYKGMSTMLTLLQRNLFEAIFSTLQSTDVENLEILIRLDSLWRAEDWESRGLDNIIDAKDFSHMKCVFLDTSPESFVQETMERLRNVDRPHLRTASCVVPEEKDAQPDGPQRWNGWNSDEHIIGRGLPTHIEATGRPVELEDFSEDSPFGIQCAYSHLWLLHCSWDCIH